MIEHIDFSVGFQMFKIQYFQMALNRCELWSKGIKSYFMPKNCKNRPAFEGFSPKPS